MYLLNIFLYVVIYFSTEAWLLFTELYDRDPFFPSDRDYAQKIHNRMNWLFIMRYGYYDFRVTRTYNHLAS